MKRRFDTIWLLRIPKVNTVVILFLSSIFFANHSFSQKINTFGKRSQIVTIGYGYKSWYQSAMILYDYSYEKIFDTIGPLHIKYEYGLADKIGIGISFGYHKYHDSNNQPVLGYRFIGKINYHFFANKKWDAYCDAGVGAGRFEAKYVLESSPPQIITDKLLTLEIEVGLGARYYFTKNVGLYIEAGIGKTIFQGGLAIALTNKNETFR